MNLSTLTVAGMALCALVACDQTLPTIDTDADPSGETSVLQVAPEALRNAQLGYEKASSHPIQERISAYGEITPQADKMASIVSRVSGIVVDIRKQLGESVDEGEVVAVLESQALAEAVMRYLQAESTLEAAKKAFAREKELFGKKLTSAEAYQGAEQALQTAKITHATTRQSLQLLHFEESELHAYLDAPESADLTRFPIRSPLNGVVTNREIHRGEAVAADAPLFKIADLEEVCVHFHVPLESVRYLEKGGLVNVADDSAAQAADATVTFVSPIASESSRTVTVRAALTNTQGHWRPGTPVTVTMKRTAANAAIAIPSDALLDYEGGYVVFVQEREGVFHLREVEPGRRDDAFVEIKSGLREGETVVTTNAFALKALWQSQGA